MEGTPEDRQDLATESSLPLASDCDIQPDRVPPPQTGGDQPTTRPSFIPCTDCHGRLRSAGGGPRALPTRSRETAAHVWTKEEDALLVAMHSRNESWDSMSRQLSGRSSLACRFRYAYLRLRPEWNEETKDSVAFWYQTYKSQVWAEIAGKVRLPEGEVEALAWKLGPWEMARRAAVVAIGLEYQT